MGRNQFTKGRSGFRPTKKVLPKFCYILSMLNFKKFCNNLLFSLTPYQNNIYIGSFLVVGVKKKSNRSSYGLLLKRPCLKRVLVNGDKDSGDSMDSADLTNSSDLSDSVNSLFSSVSIHSFLKGYTNFSI